MVKEPRLRKSELERIDAPTLITAGERDMIRQEHTEWMHSCIRGSELSILPGDHFTPFEHTQEYIRVVSDFYEGIVN